MQQTQWLIGRVDSKLLPHVGSRLPQGFVSTKYLLIENEAPLGLDNIGFVNTAIIKGFNTKVAYTFSSLDVYMNGTKIDVIETGSNSYTVPGNHSGYMTVNYVPQDEVDLWADLSRYDALKKSTNVNLRFVDITHQIIEQMRYAVNNLESTGGVEQTRWCGGYYSDEFALATYDNENDVYSSNLRLYITEVTPQMIYELIDAVQEDSTKLGILVGDTYDTELIYSKLGVPYSAIEFIRRYINQLEAAIEV